MSKIHSSTIQALIYPDSQKIDKTFLDKNKKEIKKIQIDNKAKKEEKENNIPSKLYFKLNFKTSRSS